MSKFNQINFLGRLGADPELRKAGTQDVCAMRCAMSTSDKENDTVWLSVNVWGKPAHWCKERLRKGDLALFTGGELRVREYETRDGQKRQSLEVGGFNLNVQFLPKAGDNPSKPGPVRAPAVTMTPNPVGSDDDIPF